MKPGMTPGMKPDPTGTTPASRPTSFLAHPLLRNRVFVVLAGAALLVAAFFLYVRLAFPGVRCEAARHLDAPEKMGDCYGCHIKSTPRVAQDWYEGKHGITLVRCQTCHGQPDGKGAIAFNRSPGVEICARCHAPSMDRMEAKFGTRGNCSTCHPNHQNPMHGDAYVNRQATTKTTLD